MAIDTSPEKPDERAPAAPPTKADEATGRGDDFCDQFFADDDRGETQP
jgi:hypothetical protein